MINQLNFYSRFNRIKHHLKIPSLYCLLNQMSFESFCDDTQLLIGRNFNPQENFQKKGQLLPTQLICDREEQKEQNFPKEEQMKCLDFNYKKEKNIVFQQKKISPETEQFMMKKSLNYQKNDLQFINNKGIVQSVGQNSSPSEVIEHVKLMKKDIQYDYEKVQQQKNDKKQDNIKKNINRSYSEVIIGNKQFSFDDRKESAQDENYPSNIIRQDEKQICNSIENQQFSHKITDKTLFHLYKSSLLPKIIQHQLNHPREKKDTQNLLEISDKQKNSQLNEQNSCNMNTLLSFQKAVSSEQNKQLNRKYTIKKSFKKLMKKQLNPRMVTSTILNEQQSNRNSVIKELESENTNNNGVENNKGIKQEVKEIKINFKSKIKNKQILSEDDKAKSKQIRIKKTKNEQKSNKKLLKCFFDAN